MGRHVSRNIASQKKYSIDDPEMTSHLLLHICLLSLIDQSIYPYRVELEFHYKDKRVKIGETCLQKNHQSEKHSINDAEMTPFGTKMIGRVYIESRKVVGPL